MYISLLINIRSSFIHVHGFQLLLLFSLFFCLYQQNKFSESKVKFRQANNRCKSVPEAAKLVYAKKTKGSITSQKLSSQDFWQIASSVQNKRKSAISPLFNISLVLSSESDKAKLFAKICTKNSYLDDCGISLLVFPSSTNLKLHNIFVTPKANFLFLVWFLVYWINCRSSDSCI